MYEVLGGYILFWKASLFQASSLHASTEQTTWEDDVRSRLKPQRKGLGFFFLIAFTWTDEEKMRVDLFWICLWCFLRPGAAGQGQSTAVCSPSCSCDEDGGADCSGRGLTTVPTGLRAFTYYLWVLTQHAQPPKNMSVCTLNMSHREGLGCVCITSGH